jgi:uroporphyrin-III C-methyltransferase
VVRLKGGDPMLFGRADEELRALEAEGIEVEVVPGITTAVAAAAATKQPLTKRGVARSVAFFTSSTAPDEPDHPPCPKPTPWCSTWAAAKPPPPPSACWREGGVGPAGGGGGKLQPPDQRIVRLTLADLAHGLEAAHGPVLVMIGEALQRREHQAAG